MSIIKQKNKRFYSIIFITIYSVFLLISFTHSHHFIVPGKNIEVINNSKESNKTNDFIFGFGNKCLIHQFNSSVISYHFSNSRISEIVKNELAIINKLEFLPRTIFYLNSPLRAPPIDMFT